MQRKTLKALGLLTLAALAAAAVLVWRPWSREAQPDPNVPPPPGAGLKVAAPETATVFGLCELRVEFGKGLEALAALPDAQVHDAYDADRDGAFVRLSAEFEHESGRRVTVPGFAMRESAGGGWQWRVRWSPRRPGKWKCRLMLEGRAGRDGQAVLASRALKAAITAKTVPGITGPLVAPGKGQHPGYLRRLRPDGTSKSLWLFGACRAWVVNMQDRHNDWYPHEWIDREKELLAPMRAAGFNLLNQWMAPWEFLLVHHDRAEFWKGPKGTWKRRPLSKDAAWTPYQSYDQGRARAFDQLVTLCEGGPGKPTVHLLLSPLPHQCLQLAEHPWGAQESGWSPTNDAGKQTLERLNGFSAFRKDMKVWEFFGADPARPLDDPRSQLFDHQANYFRYLIARWGYSRAVGLWVLVDELDAVGDEVGVMSEKKGWWAHPECDKWLANLARLFRGRLTRSDGMAYSGDPYAHPLHAATTSYGGQAERGGNLDWSGGPPDARPDLFGWHWYPWFRKGTDWTAAWIQTIDGVSSYSRARIGRSARLVSEFGAPDRNAPGDAPSKLYPTLFHHAIWAAVFSGQAGTPMDWDDGKQFGELCPRARQGIFDRKQYPIDHTKQMKGLRAFLGKLSPEGLNSCAAKDAAVRCRPQGKLRLLALYSTKEPAIYGWAFSPDGKAKFQVTGLPAGKYLLTWYDPWTGKPAEGVKARRPTVSKGNVLKLDAGPVLAALRAAAPPFPRKSREDRGRDAAFKLMPLE